MTAFAACREEQTLNCGLMSTFHWRMWAIAFIKRLQKYGQIQFIDALKKKKKEKVKKTFFWRIQKSSPSWLTAKCAAVAKQHNVAVASFVLQRAI